MLSNAFLVCLCCVASLLGHAQQDVCSHQQDAQQDVGCVFTAGDGQTILSGFSLYLVSKMPTSTPHGPAGSATSVPRASQNTPAWPLGRFSFTLDGSGLIIQFCWLSLYAQGLRGE